MMCDCDHNEVCEECLPKPKMPREIWADLDSWTCALLKGLPDSDGNERQHYTNTQQAIEELRGMEPVTDCDLQYQGYHTDYGLGYNQALEDAIKMLEGK